MKKIALVVTAILVIGIQGCSTDDKPEQLGDTVTDNFILATNAVEGKSLGGGGTFERIFVVYTPGSTSMDNEDYVQSSLKFGRFSSIFYGRNPYCADVYEWYVPSNELPDYFCTTKCEVEEIPKTDGDGTTAHSASNPNNLGTSSDDETVCPSCKENASWSWINNNSPNCNQIKSSFVQYQ